MKTSIIVHNPCNDLTKHYRYYNLFWDKFTHYLKNFFYVEENRYFEKAHEQPFNIKLKKGISDIIPILDCEYVIENKDSGEYLVISVCDRPMTHIVVNEKDNIYQKKVLISQFDRKSILENLKLKKLHKHKPWFYFKQGLIDLETYYFKRIYNKPIYDKLYFKGTALEHRKILSYINKNIITNFTPINPDNYFEDLIKYKIGLSIDGAAEFCYRDIEYLAIGIPMIRFEYESEFNKKLIPNYHYISVPRPKNMVSYPLSDESCAKILENRYYEVINDDDFLQFISKNGREYYLKNLTMDNMVKNTFNILQLNKWIIK